MKEGDQFIEDIIRQQKEENLQARHYTAHRYLDWLLAQEKQQENEYYWTIWANLKKN
mgnify:CR=1 FL=1|jgi:hypothetical protein|tara:strand:- start:3992 stop:4162 length:171 start_codon:yes stop_codon:yes gene_type:complete